MYLSHTCPALPGGHPSVKSEKLANCLFQVKFDLKSLPIIFYSGVFSGETSANCLFQVRKNWQSEENHDEQVQHDYIGIVVP